MRRAAHALSHTPRTHPLFATRVSLTYASPPFRLEILSLARNNITRIEGLEPVAATLQQLWLSYNMVSKLEGLKGLPQLKVLYLANNLIRDVKELENLPPSLEARPGTHTRRTACVLYARALTLALFSVSVFQELSLVGTPLYEAARGEKGEVNVLAVGSLYRCEVLRRVPALKKLDGVPVDSDEVETARNRTPATASAGLGVGLGETTKPK